MGSSCWKYETGLVGDEHWQRDFHGSLPSIRPVPAIVWLVDPTRLDSLRHILRSHWWQMYRKFLLFGQDVDIVEKASCSQIGACNHGNIF